MEDFEKWFKGSKVVKNKEPLLVYHGTTEDFDTFITDPLQKNSVCGIGENAIGACFTEDYDIARHYPVSYRNEDRKVITAYLSIKKPKRYRSITGVRNHMLDFYEEHGISYLHDLGDSKSILRDVKKFKDFLIQNGYDGITYMEGPPYNITKNKARVWVAFHPEQIRMVKKMAYRIM